MTESIDDIEREIRRGLRGIDGPWLTFKHWVRGHKWFLVALIAIAFILLSSVAVNAAGIWRPHLIIFATTPVSPMTTVIGQFPKVFTEEQACEDFIAEKRKEISIPTIHVPGIDIVHHEMDCLLDETGDGI